MPLPREFFERSPAKVARELLGKILVHNSPGGRTSGIIVETEAYFGKGDPASRASRKRTPLNELMWGRGGLAFIYMVHGRWMFNITAEKKGVPGAVLIRALEPLEGIELMKRRRGTEKDFLLTSGPGRLTEAMGITKKLHGVDVTTPNSCLMVMPGAEKLPISTSHRIGVKKDLKRKLRFFVTKNPYVSKL
ncbi:MAG: DNA-3-methyladenine glycosylase [Candidatus Hadarchaeales archaeon]